MAVQELNSTVSGKQVVQWHPQEVQKYTAMSDQEASAHVKDLTAAIQQLLKRTAPPEPPKWTWTQIAKYGAYTAGAGALGYYGYTQLWDIAKKIDPVAKTAAQIIKKSTPDTLATINTGISGVQQSAGLFGSAIASVRNTLNNMGVATPPLPTTQAEKARLGLQAGINFAVFGTAAKVGAAILNPALVATKFIGPLNPDLVAATVATASIIEAAAPGLPGNLTQKAVDNREASAGVAVTGLILFTLQKTLISAVSTVAAFCFSPIRRLFHKPA